MFEFDKMLEEHGEPQFSWKKGLLHTLAVMVLFVLVAALSTPFDNIKTQAQADKLAEGFGKMGGWVLVLSLLCSYGVQKQKRGLAWLGGIGVALLFAFVIGLSLLVESAPPPPRALTNEDRQALLILGEGAEKHLKHPHLGFTLNYPGEQFQYLNDAEAKAIARDFFDPRLDIQIYAFIQEETGEAMMVIASGETINRSYLEGFVKGFEEQSGQITKKEILWSDEKKEAILQAKLGPVEAYIRGIAADLGPKRLPYFLAIVVLSPDAARRRDLAESLRLP